jgi:hypothetical protein
LQKCGGGSVELLQLKGEEAHPTVEQFQLEKANRQCVNIGDLQGLESQ